MKFEKNQEIRFKHPSVLSGIPLILTGIVKGNGKDVRKMWPIEMGEAPDDMLLVWRQDYLGQSYFYAVSPAEVIENPTVEFKEN